MGYTVLSIAYGYHHMSLFSILGLSIALGTGCMALGLFWISLAGFKPSRTILIIMACVFSALLAILWKKNKLILPIIYPPLKEMLGKNYLAFICFLFIQALVIVVSIHALAFPLFEWDAFAIWGLKAKVLALESLRYPSEYFYDHSLSYSHQDYPLLFPFLVSGVYGAIGYVDDQVGKIVLPLLYISFGLLVYSGLRWQITRNQAAALTAFLMEIPVLLRWAGSGYADLALTMYYAGSIFFLLKWLREEIYSDLSMAILFSVFCFFTKKEGIGLSIINVIGIGLFSINHFSRRRMIGFFLFVACTSLLLLSWIVWSWNLPRTHDNYASQFHLRIIVENLHRLKIIIPQFLNQIIQWNRWGSLWIVLVVASLLGWRAFRKQHVIALWALLGMHFGLYIFIYIITPWEIQSHIQVSLERLILHITPAAILIIGYHWNVIVRKEDIMENDCNPLQENGK
tara:strand:+ start:24519 stop:25886 length:1368 start_codon:yes stop_codon:yes gene_type:complete